MRGFLFFGGAGAALAAYEALGWRACVGVLLLYSAISLGEELTRPREGKEG